MPEITIEASPAMMNLLKIVEGNLGDDFKIQWIVDHWDEIRIGSKVING